jgi:DNA repair exonuclease SbcCD ATPase subunit
VTRTIRLSRVHALNWYGYQDTIPADGNLLVAGVTGSGKSVLMDLIQFVLIGDQRVLRFNQSATGDRSDRTLKGYCLGDTKEDEDGVAQYMRQSAITYAALEFTWPSGKKIETWGIRVEFASAAEAHGRVTPFFALGSLERNDFLDGGKRPLDHAAFKAIVERHGGRLYTEGVDAYLRDMAQPPHLNFDRTVLRSLLPTAMSFTFLRSFNDFARQFILPADKLDVTDVTASYRAFRGYERDLIQLTDQFNKLAAIRDTFVRWTELERDRVVARYLEAELRHQHAAEELTEAGVKLQTLREACAEENKRLQQIDDAIPRGRAEVQELAALINQTAEGQLYTFIRSRNADLTHDIATLSAIGTTLEQALERRAHRARAWLADVRAVPLTLDADLVTAVERAITAVEAGGVAHAGRTLRELSDAAARGAAEVDRAAAPNRRRLVEVRQRLDQLRAEIAALRLGKLPFPTRLLDELNAGLRRHGGELPARHLRELCEVTDERWRPAIEVAFAQKFAVVVAPEDYDEAQRIYHSLKPADLSPDGGHESLMNPTKALELKRPIHPGSLAEKLRPTHPVAAAIIADLFGDMMCVEHLDKLREHDSAILPDGFMVRGAFVERPGFYDGNPFVGKRGLEQQRAWKEKQRDELEAEERRLAPLDEAVQRVNEDWRDQFDIPADLHQDLARAERLPELRRELDENTAKLNAIDRAKFDELAKRQIEIEDSLRRLEDERRRLDRSEKRTHLRAAEAAVQKKQGEVEALFTKFATVRSESDMSQWLKQLGEMRAAILAEFPIKDVAAGRCRDTFHDADRDAAAAWEELKAKRRELALVHSKFDELPTEAKDNAAYMRHLETLERSDIPDYTAKAERERKNWEGLFRTQVLEKLARALRELRDLIVLLNNSLKQRPIGNDHYEFRHRRNPDYAIWHDLLEASALARSDDLFFASVEPRFREAIQRFLQMLTDEPDGAEAVRLLDYRHYYEYDMEVVEADGRKTSVNRQSGKFSGGENQAPYFIAILASYLRAYRRYNSRRQDPSLGLVPIDEAFSKLSGERIKDCITALQTFDLQGIFSMSTGNIPYAFEHCDRLVVVSKEERRVGKRLQIRNIPVSLARDSVEARRLMGV